MKMSPRRFLIVHGFLFGHDMSLIQIVWRYCLLMNGFLGFVSVDSRTEALCARCSNNSCWD